MTCRLYLITPPKFKLQEFITSFENALEGGDVAILQLRMKDVSEKEIITAAKELLPICRKNDVAFVINDSPEIAKLVDADGVHIGEDTDGSVKHARAIIGEDKIVGVSCYASKDRAFCAGEDGADYVSFGAFYHTETKKPKGYPTPDLLEFWSENTIVSCVAIGGIKPHNTAPLVKAGADFIAVVTGVWDNPKGTKAAVEEYNQIIRNALQLSTEHL